MKLSIINKEEVEMMKYVHTTIQVRNIDNCIRFYEEVIGLQVKRRFMSGKKDIVFLAHDDQTVCIELIENSEKPPFNGSGISLGFESDNIEKDYKRIVDLGIQVTELIKPNPQTSLFYFSDPSGVTIQFIQEKEVGNE